MTEETKYLWDKDNIVSFMDSSNNVTKKHYRGYQLICDDADKYYMHDPHGNVIETYESGETTPYDRYYYNAFGTQDGFDDTDMIERNNEWGYCDQLYDAYTNDYYMRARYYSPSIGRFISEDTHWNPSNMIYGDKKYEKDEKRYPDYTAVLQSSNLYGYCMGNPVKYYDKTGNIITEAGILVYAAWVALNIAVDVAAGYVAIKFTDLALQEQNKIKKAVSYNDIPASYYIKWNKDDNGKNHVINGSRVGSEKNHLPIWKKLGYDPKDPKGYDKLLAIFKTVVNSGYIKSTQRCYDHGKQIGMYILYENDFVSKGVSVCVKIYTSLETGYSYFSDAWGEIIGK